ncbi:MAG: ATP-binding protein [Planctomycetota bacterium]
MWIKNARVDGFGRIVGGELQFARGLNCIHGANESGKTTLMQFLISMLYGQAKPGVTKRILDETHERYLPWGGGAYGGSLRLALGDGTEAILRRDFRESAEGIELLDAVSGKSMLDRYERNRLREYQFMRAITGLGKRTFAASFVVDHASLAELSEESRKTLGHRLMSLVQSMSESAGAEKAHERLGKMLEEIGGERAPTKPLARTAEALGAARSDLEAARRANEDLSTDIERRAELESRISALKADISTRGALLYRSLVALVQNDERDIARLKEEIAGVGPAELPEKLAALDPETLRRAETALVEFVERRRDLADALSRQTELTSQAERMQREIDEGSRTLQAITEEHRVFLASAADQKSEILEQLGTARQSVAEVERVRSGKSSSLILAVVAGVAGVVAAGLAYGFAAEGVRVTAAVAAVSIGLVVALVLAVRSAGLARKLARLEAGKQDHAELERRLAEHDLKLNEILGVFGAESRDEVLEALNEFDSQKQALERITGELSEISGTAEKQRSAADRSWLTAWELLSGTGMKPLGSLKEAVEQLLSGEQAGEGDSVTDASAVYTDAATPSAVSEAFRPVYSRIESAAAARQHLSQLNSQVTKLEGRMKELLAGMSLEELHERESAAAELPPETELTPFEEIAALRQGVRTLEEEHSAVELELAQVAAKVEEGLKGFADIADVEDRISVLEERRELQLHYRKALEEAIGVIDEATRSLHSRIFPRLEKSLSELLNAVTLGAHREAKLWTDEEERGAPIRLSVLDELKGAPVAPEVLSQGACEQLYLCARLALAQALSREDAAPVILDDPFINYDPARLEAAMAVVGEAAAGRQVFLLTCQKDVRDLAAGVGAHVIELA